MNPQFENSFSSTIPIIEDVETPTKTPTETHDKTPVETHDETLVKTCTKTQPIFFLREPPYNERLALQKAVEQPRFNILG